MGVSINPLFDDGMVFASGKEIRVFGEGNGKVEVTFNGCKKELISNSPSWCIKFPAMDYGGPYSMEVSLDGEERVISDIYIGEVILLAGQSNIQFKMRESTAIHSEYRDHESLRLFTLDRWLEKNNNEHFLPKDGWVKCKAGEAGYWSALGYYVGQELSRVKNCAVGLIACYQGASVIESWLSEGVLEVLGYSFADFHPNYKEMAKNTPWNVPGTLYREMFMKIPPFLPSQVIWYQGESDTSAAEGAVYGKLLAKLIEVWREAFMDETLPFVVVQIADYDKRCDEGWHSVQKAQMEIQEEVAYTKTVVCADICERDCIHPPTKRKLGLRIVKALASVDGMDR